MYDKGLYKGFCKQRNEMELKQFLEKSLMELKYISNLRNKTLKMLLNFFQHLCIQRNGMEWKRFFQKTVEKCCKILFQHFCIQRNEMELEQFKKKPSGIET